MRNVMWSRSERAALAVLALAVPGLALSACTVAMIGRGEDADAGTAREDAAPSTVELDAARAEPTAPMPEPEPEDTCDRGLRTPDLPGSVRDACTGSVAFPTAAWAVCACEDVRVQGYVRTHAIDSRGMPADPTRGGAAVGVNRALVAASYLDIGGTLVVAEPGGDGLALAGALEVAGDLAVGGGARSAGWVSIARDASFEGDVTLAGAISVGRDLVMPAGRSLRAVPLVRGARRSEPVEVARPCDCSAPLDVGRLVDAARADNDDALVGLDPRAWRSLVGAGSFELPCGRYYVESIGGTGALRLGVTGHVSLYVGGDVDVTGALLVELADGATLDVFVRGDLRALGASALGDPSRPAAMRIHVGGSGDIALTGAAAIAAHLDAPRARLTAPGALLLRGSLFVRAIELAGALEVIWDRAFTSIGDDCPPPPDDGCDRCDGTCGTAACVDGACGACESDADCCAPLVCAAGVCTSVPI